MSVLLLGPGLRALYASPEALQILAYPETAEKVGALDSFLHQKVRSSLLVDGTYPQSGFVSEFSSGRRCYVCRAFSLNSQPQNSSDAPLTALLFERRGYFDATQVAARFRLTQRENQTLKYLMLGLTNKEIAEQLKISPNTVKAFLKLLMMKMGVSTRSGIVGKAMAVTAVTAKAPDASRISPNGV